MVLKASGAVRLSPDSGLSTTFKSHYIALDKFAALTCTPTNDSNKRSAFLSITRTS